MKFLLPIFAIALTSQAAMAEKIYCSFTEPFINLTYDSDTNKIVASTPNNPDQEATVKVTFNQGGTIMFMTISNDHNLVIDTTKTGSDGMSDFIYPFDAVLDGKLYGGCETDHIKKKLSTLHGYCAK